jgi:hypothetical protein
VVIYTISILNFDSRLEGWVDFVPYPVEVKVKTFGGLSALACFLIAHVGIEKHRLSR